MNRNQITFLFCAWVSEMSSFVTEEETKAWVSEKYSSVTEALSFFLF